MMRLGLSLIAVLCVCLNLHAQDFFADGDNSSLQDEQPAVATEKPNLADGFGDEAPIKDESALSVDSPSVQSNDVEKTKAEMQANEQEGTGKAFNELPDQDENGCLIGEKGDSCRNVIGKEEDKDAERLAAKEVKENFDGINVSVSKCTNKEFYYSNFEVCDYFFKKLN